MVDLERAEGDSELYEWCSLVTKFRSHELEETTNAARDRLEVLMTLRGRQRQQFASYRRAFGEVRFETCLEHTIRGRWTRRSGHGSDEPEPKGINRLSDERWYAGIIDHLEWDELAHANPIGVFNTAFERRLIDETRRPLGPDVGVISIERGVSDQEGERLPILTVASIGSPHDPTAVPADAARTLREASGFAAVACRIAPALSSGHPLRAIDRADSKLPLLIACWSELDGYLRHDVVLGDARPRWKPDAKPAHDFWSRAWQVSYHTHEHNDDFTDPTEVPNHERSRRESNQYHKHLSRFRAHYKLAVTTAMAVVTAARDPQDRTQLRGSRPGARVPIEWEPADHPSLHGRVKGPEGST